MSYAPLLTMALLTWPLLVVCAAWAAPPGLLPPAHTQGTVTYVSGGIGHEEAQTFTAALSQYPLALEFAVRRQEHGTFLAQVHTTISLPQGHVLLDTWSQGPFLLVNLPSDDYLVSATYEGSTLIHCVRVSPLKPVHILFLWNVPPSGNTPTEPASQPSVLRPGTSGRYICSGVH
jgi:hypothetical protein